MIDITENEIKTQWTKCNKRPIVSICCTTYNHEKYIAAALDGFLMQKTNFAFEILIRDDCSTDKTALIIEKYVKKFPTIIKPLFMQENTFSKGIKPMPELYKIAQGEYIALCEGDDYWTDDRKLQLQKDFLENNKEYVITYTKVKAFDKNGVLEEYEGGLLKDLSSEELLSAPPLNTLTVMFRNKLKIMPKEFVCTYYGDLFLWSLLGSFGKGKFLENIQPSIYRVHEGGLHSMISEQNKKDMLFITYNALYAYYMRIGEKRTANIFKYKNFQTFSNKDLIKMYYKKNLQYLLDFLHIVMTSILRIIKRKMDE